MKRKQMIWKVLAVVVIIGSLWAANVPAADESISGTVKLTDEGIIISADDGQTYSVYGQDLSAMVGKSVNASGTLQESESGRTILVTHVVEIKKKKE